MAGTKADPKCKTCGRIRAVFEMDGPMAWLGCGVCDIMAAPCPYRWRPFPILNVSRRSMAWQPRWPTAMPWGLLWPHGTQAQANHGQSLKRLAERGGLDPVEMLKVIEGTPWRTADQQPLMLVAMERLRRYRIHWMRRNRNRKGSD